jgi:hypothetical protein
MKKPVQVQDYEKDKEEDEGEVILTSLMGVPVRCKAISGMCRKNAGAPLYSENRRISIEPYLAPDPLITTPIVFRAIHISSAMLFFLMYRTSSASFCRYPSVYSGYP